MTVKELLNYAIIETKKNNAPNLLIEDYNYFINKAILQYINTVYNVYNADQQRTDDLRVLKGFGKLKLNKKIGNEAGEGLISDLNNFGAIYEVTLPNDYFHLIACQVIFNIKETFRCYDANDKWVKGATRATGELNSETINNAYFRPSYRTPYYYIINNYSTFDDEYFESMSKIEYTEDDFKLISPDKMVGSTLDIIYKGLNAADKSKVDNQYKTNRASLVIGGVNLSQCTNPVDAKSLLNKRYNNVILQIRAGDDSIFEPEAVYVDYIKTPQYVRLSQRQFDSDRDTSQVLEFPPYVCQEILNILIRLLLENYSDPRIQTNPAINQTIAPPVQMQAQQQNSR